MTWLQAILIGCVITTLLISIAKADNLYEGIVLGGDSENIIVPEHGWKYGRSITKHLQEQADQTGSGGHTTNKIRYYDVILQVNEPPTDIYSYLNLNWGSYEPGDTVNAQLLIDIQGNYTPPQDGILTTYAINPQGTRLPSTIITIKEGDHNKKIQYKLPNTLLEGTYTLTTEWKVPGLDLITSQDTFNVLAPKKIRLHNLILTIILITITILLIKKRNKKQNDK